MSEDQQRRDSNAVLEHLRHLPILGGIASKIDQIIDLVQTRKRLRGYFPGVQPGVDKIFTFDGVQAIYVDNVTNTNGITISFDNEPLTFQIAASSGRFLPATGAKQFKIAGTLSAGSNVNVMYANYDMSYN